MNEELNQVQETEVLENGNDDENLFDDIPEETTEGDEETNEINDESVTDETDSTDESTTEETSETPFGLKIKYNGEEMNLDEEQARTLAQKGMNYDRFYEPIERLARLNNMSVGDYLNRLNETQFQYEVSKEIDNLRNDPKYDNVSDEVLEEIATNRVNENISLRDQNYEDTQREQADAQQARVQRDIDLFFQEYPEFKNKGPEALDSKVFDYVKQGYTLLEAYNKWSREQVNPQALAKEKANKLNEENKKKSLGNTTNAGSVESDDFLNGFLKG